MTFFIQYPHSIHDIESAVAQGEWPAYWDPGRKELVGRQQRLLLELAQRLVRFARDEPAQGKSALPTGTYMARALLGEVPDQKPPKASLQREFGRALLGRLRQPRESRRVTRDRDLLYHQLIQDCIQDLGVELCRPSYPVLVQRDRSRLRRGFKEVDLVRRIRQTLIERLEQGDVALFDQHRAGACLLSALLWGGLCSREGLEAFNRTLEQPFELGPSGAWMDLELHPETTRSRIRRFFPDPVTEILVLHFPPTVQENAQAAVDPLLSELGFPATGLRRLLRGMAGGLALEMSEVLVGYAADELLHHSIESPRWLGIQGLVPEAGEEAVESEPSPSSNLNDLAATLENEEDADVSALLALTDVPGLDAVGRAVRSSSLPVLREGLARVLQDKEQLPPIVRLLATWLYRPPGKAEASTRRRLFDSVGRRLASAVGGEEDPTQLPGAEVETVYQSILDQATSASHSQAIRIALRSFDRHAFRRGPNEHPETITGTDQTPVSARLITFDEYEQIRDILGRPHPNIHDPRWSEAAQILLTLYFRLGLRRQEVLDLPLQDVQGHADDLTLLVRPGPDRPIKTPNARRALPMRDFLSPEEYQQFVEWVRWRYERVPSPSPRTRLLALPDRGKERLPDPYFPNHITDAMRRVTADPTLRLHHLRRSYASWMALAEIGHAEGDSFSAWDHLPLTRDWLRRAPERLDRYYQVVEPVRRHRLYQIAELMGHSSPGTTMEYYIHTLDPLLRDTVWAVVGITPSTLHHRLIGQSERNFRRILKTGWEGFREHARKQARPERIVRRAERPIRTTAVEDRFTVAFLCRYQEAWDGLKWMADNHFGPRTASPKSRHTLSDLQTWVAQAHILRTNGVTRKDVPGYPSGNRQLEWVDTLGQQIAAAFETDTAVRAAWQRIVTTWSSPRPHGRSGACFFEPGSAKGYLEDLRSLGIRWSQLRFTWLHPGVTVHRGRELQASWRRELGLTRAIGFEIGRMSEGWFATRAKEQGMLEIAVTPDHYPTETRSWNWIMAMAWITEGGGMSG